MLTRPRCIAAICAGVMACGLLIPAAVRAETGKVSYYGAGFAGHRTANGQRFDPAALTMAHRTLPFGSQVRVTNTANRRSVVVRVNDRGPATPGRIGDVSLAAARRLGMLQRGVIRAELTVITPH